ncbi:MAG TPA: hypothetical protein VFP86_20950 [bacterium]|nr:hypothetical protein [bacterium]
MTPKELDKYRRIVEEAVVALGRDDVGVNVEDGGPGVLAVTFSRGAHSHSASIPMDQLSTHEAAHAAVTGAVLALSKAVAQEALAKAAR